MKVIDSNAFIGHWPFRRLRGSGAEGLLRLMKDKGIDKAAVSSIHSIFYKNPHQGNLEISEDINRNPDRLAGVCVLSPKYPAWERDLRYSREELNMKGLKLFPKYHNYGLTDPDCLKLAEAASEMGWPVFIPMRVVDLRQRHWLDAAENVSWEEVAAFMEECPRVKLILQNGVYPCEKAREEPLLMNGNVFFEISRLASVYARTLVSLIEAVGVERVVFGTGIPFNYPEPAFLKTALLGLNEEDEAKLLHGNIARLTGI